jgi:hypothetical protein
VHLVADPSLGRIMPTWMNTTTQENTLLLSTTVAMKMTIRMKTPMVTFMNTVVVATIIPMLQASPLRLQLVVAARSTAAVSSSAKVDY